MSCKVIKNIIFDLGGVLFVRDPSRVTPAVTEFFSFIADKKMPEFWEEYDRGARTLEQTIQHLCQIKGCSREQCVEYVQESIDLQEPLPPTQALVRELKAKGYRLYVLSNMSRDYIAMLRQQSVYSCFDGEVVSCEEHCVKPEPRIYEILLQRYSLEPCNSLFIDDRPENLETARQFDINTYLFERYRAEECCEQIRSIVGL